MESCSLTRGQILTILTIVVISFCNAMCGSMQAPFFPKVAVSKGLDVWHFGMVLGTFEITIFLSSPLIGASIHQVGCKKTLTAGLSVVGTTLILYGFLGWLQSGKLFLTLCLILRMFEACGISAFLTGSFNAIARQFPNREATMFAMIELFYGVGEILGPVFGGFLFELGGFALPFITLGSAVFLSAILVCLIFPQVEETPQDNPCNNLKSESITASSTNYHGLGSPGPSMCQALFHLDIFIAFYSVFAGAASLGFIQATLEPHISSFYDDTVQLSSFQVGALFMVSGGSYGLGLPLWGVLCDVGGARAAGGSVKSTASLIAPKLVELAGGLLIIAGFLVLGPMMYLPFTKSIESVIVGMALHGAGLGAAVVGGFSDAQKSSIRCGFPDNPTTYGLVSGLWTSAFALGGFIGPTVGGVLYDAVSFQWAIFLVIGLEVISVLLVTCYIFGSCINRLCELRRSNPPGWESLSEKESGNTSCGSTSDILVPSILCTTSPGSMPTKGACLASSLARSLVQPRYMSAEAVSRRRLDSDTLIPYLGSVNGPY